EKGTDDTKTISSTMEKSITLAQESPIRGNSATVDAVAAAVHLRIPQTTYEEEDKNFETFALAWCDANVNKSKDNLRIQMKLRETVNFIRTFDDSVSCELWLKRRRANSGDKIILITSGRLGRELVPKVHDLSQLVSIYIFCTDKCSNENWSKTFQKVRGCSSGWQKD
ncbi:unnamed protein product, partial [Rotaria sp. Silwood2]